MKRCERRQGKTFSEMSEIQHDGCPLLMFRFPSLTEVRNLIYLQRKFVKTKSEFYRVYKMFEKTA